MGYVTVSFLGTEYQVSETIKDFLHYDELLTPVRLEIISMLKQDIKRDSVSMTFGEETPEIIINSATKYQGLLEKSAETLVNEFFVLGIYDVTANDLLNQTTAIESLSKLKKHTIDEMLNEGERYVNLKRKGMEEAYRSAVSKITGSGTMIFSSSIITLMIHSVVERGILMHQANEADKEYEKAVKALTESTNHALDKMTCEVMVKKYYPALMEILMDFTTKITSIFLCELVQHGKFDFDSVKNYNLKKAEEMLNNLNRVPKVIDFLKQVFNVCPYSLALYETCLECGLLDEDTFETARYFGFAENLVEKIETYIHDNQLEINTVKSLLSILARNKNVEISSMGEKLLRERLINIKNTYNTYKTALVDKSMLDYLIRKHINLQTKTAITTPEEKIKIIFYNYLDSLLPENLYCELTELHLISLSDIRMTNSRTESLRECNEEIINALMLVIREYITEALWRWNRYDESRKHLVRNVHQMNSELQELITEKEKLNFFSWGKKKQLTFAIKNKKEEIEKYQKTHESNVLLDEFEKMYR